MKVIKTEGEQSWRNESHKIVFTEEPSKSAKAWLYHTFVKHIPGELIAEWKGATFIVSGENVSKLQKLRNKLSLVKQFVYTIPKENKMYFDQNIEEIKKAAQGKCFIEHCGKKIYFYGTQEKYNKWERQVRQINETSLWNIKTIWIAIACVAVVMFIYIDMDKPGSTAQLNTGQNINIFNAVPRKEIFAEVRSPQIYDSKATIADTVSNQDVTHKIDSNPSLPNDKQANVTVITSLTVRIAIVSDSKSLGLITKSVFETHRNSTESKSPNTPGIPVYYEYDIVPVSKKQLDGYAIVWEVLFSNPHREPTSYLQNVDFPIKRYIILQPLATAKSDDPGSKLPFCSELIYNLLYDDDSHYIQLNHEDAFLKQFDQAVLDWQMNTNQ